MALRAAAQTGRSTAAGTHRRSAEDHGRWPLIRDGVALLAVVLGIFLGIVVFLPTEGRVASPAHDFVTLLLGRAVFLLPIGLFAGGVVTLVRSFLPEAPIPYARLVGVALLAFALPPTLHLVGAEGQPSLQRALAHEGGGYVGHWISTGLLDSVGGPATAALLACAFGVGLLLSFDVTVAQVVAVLVLGGQWLGEHLMAAARASIAALRKPRPATAAGTREARVANRGAPARGGSIALHRPALGLTLPKLSLPFGRPALPQATNAAVVAPDEEDLEDEAEEPDQSFAVFRRSGPPAVQPEPGLEPEPVEDEEYDQGEDEDLDELHLEEAPAEHWELPGIEVFKPRAQSELSATDLKARARIIEDTLASFNVDARVVEMNQGPAVTQFGIEPAEGVAVNRILSRQNDLALRLGVSPIRLEAPVPGKRMVGVEVPNASITTVTVRDILESQEWDRGRGKLRVVLGRDVSGKAVVGDLSKMPHLLIAGATGSGKSVCINTIIGSLLYQFTPAELQLVMIDPKRVELATYAEVPHLRLPVVTEMDKVVGALKWVVLEMERRYKLFAQHGVRNLEGYNNWAAGNTHTVEQPLPFMVVIIDELADMMMTAAEEVEKKLCRLAQLARATGIHLVVATQRPSVDVVTGLIKANFPTRVAFAVSSQTDSRVILDQAGAEKLLGRGDALYTPPEAMKPIRLQGAFVSDEELQALVDHWHAQGQPRYSAEEVEQIESLGRHDEDEETYDKAVELAETVGRLSASLLQRRLGLGHARAQRLLDRLIEEGIAEE